MYEVSGVGPRLAESAGSDAGILTLRPRQLGYYIRDYVDFARVIITKCAPVILLPGAGVTGRRIFVFVNVYRRVWLHPTSPEAEHFQF